MTIYQVLCYFLIYGFLGWLIEVLYEKVTTDHFINKGFLTGPFCPLYGFRAILFLLLLPSLKDHIVLLFVCSFLIASILDYVADYILEKLFHIKWWDYHKEPFHINGRICLTVSIIWGIAGVFLIDMIHPVISKIVGRIPMQIGIIVLGISGVIIIFDMIKSFVGIRSLAVDVDMSLRKQVSTLSKFQKRIILAFPRLKKLDNENIVAEIRTLLIKEKEKKKSIIEIKHPILNKLYLLICFFVIGSFIGFIFESIVCYVNYGTLYSRKGLIYGPFTPIYGGGLILFIVFFGHVQHNSKIFLGGMLVGGGFEYLCSLVQELAFGTRSWHYTKNIFNFNGRTSPFHMFVWGILTLIFMKAFYPSMKHWLEKVKPKWKSLIAVSLLLFMSINIGISWAAAVRQKDRHFGIAPQSGLDYFIDKHYPDERMDAIFSNKWWIDS